MIYQKFNLNMVWKSFLTQDDEFTLQIVITIAYKMMKIYVNEYEEFYMDYITNFKFGVLMIFAEIKPHNSLPLTFTRMFKEQVSCSTFVVNADYHLSITNNICFAECMWCQQK